MPSIPDADRGVGATLSVAGATPITSFAPLTFQQTVGLLSFVVYDETSGTFVDKSSPTVFGPDGFDGGGNGNFTFKSSLTPSLTLLGGHIYDLGAISNIESYCAYSVGPKLVANGITSTPRKVLLQNYSDSMLASLMTSDGVHGQAEFALQIENGNAPVPEPPTLGLALLPAAFLVTASAFGRGRRRRA